MRPPRRPKPRDEKFADGSDAASDPSRVRATALGLLARREHSTQELARKLESRGYDAEVAATVLAGLAGKGLLSDERYVASFITHHAARGQGPVRIRAALREVGVASELVDRLLEEAEFDWVEAARTVRQKKFKGLPTSYPARAKQSRFLQYRGFSQDQIRAAFGPESAGADPDFASDSGPDE